MAELELGDVLTVSFHFLVYWGLILKPVYCAVAQASDVAKQRQKEVQSALNSVADAMDCIDLVTTNLSLVAEICRAVSQVGLPNVMLKCAELIPCLSRSIL